MRTRPHSFNVGGVMYIFAVCCECGAGECGAKLQPGQRDMP